MNFLKQSNVIPVTKQTVMVVNGSIIWNLGTRDWRFSDQFASLLCLNHEQWPPPSTLGQLDFVLP